MKCPHCDHKLPELSWPVVQMMLEQWFQSKDWGDIQRASLVLGCCPNTLYKYRKLGENKVPRFELGLKLYYFLLAELGLVHDRTRLLKVEAYRRWMAEHRPAIRLPKTIVSPK